jgi:hypothetical protein
MELASRDPSSGTLCDVTGPARNPQQIFPSLQLRTGIPENVGHMCDIY